MVGLTPIWLMSLQAKETLDTDIDWRPYEDIVEKMAIYKPKREASKETNPPDTLILDF